MPEHIEVPQATPAPAAAPDVAAPAVAPGMGPAGAAVLARAIGNRAFAAVAAPGAPPASIEDARAGFGAVARPPHQAIARHLLEGVRTALTGGEAKRLGSGMGDAARRIAMAAQRVALERDIASWATTKGRLSHVAATLPPLADQAAADSQDAQTMHMQLESMWPLLRGIGKTQDEVCKDVYNPLRTASSLLMPLDIPREQAMVRIRGKLTFAIAMVATASGIAMAQDDAAEGGGTLDEALLSAVREQIGSVAAGLYRDASSASCQEASAVLLGIGTSLKNIRASAPSAAEAPLREANMAVLEAGNALGALGTDRAQVLSTVAGILGDAKAAVPVATEAVDDVHARKAAELAALDAADGAAE